MTDVNRGCCFPAVKRLRQASQFSAVMKSSTRLRGRSFELRYRRNEEPLARLGLIVPKRLARRAVARNLIKRLAREAFRAVSPSLPVIDVVIRLTEPVPSMSAETLKGQRKAWRADLDALLARATA